MTDNHTPEVRSYNMSRIHSNGTKPEEYVRKRLFALGFRYRKNDKRFLGKPDIVLPKFKTIVFINGCFWHWHENCPGFVMPKSKLEYWKPKLQHNKERDAIIHKKLRQEGWKVIVIWECQLKTSNRDQTIQELVEQIKAN